MIGAYCPPLKGMSDVFLSDRDRFSGGAFQTTTADYWQLARVPKIRRKQILLAPKTMVYQTKHCTLAEVGSYEDFQQKQSPAKCFS